MGHITIEEFQKLTDAKMRRLPPLVGIKSGDRIVALLMPSRKPKQRRRPPTPKRTRKATKKAWKR
jgi:hypothetical protein